MPDDTPTYDLMLLLSTGVEDDRRAKILADVEGAISGGGGSIVHNGDWGTRPMAYRIQHQQEAEYHLLQFSGPPALIETLTHSLRITDGVLRSRIIRVLPGTPPPPTPAPVPAAAASASTTAPSPSAAATATAEAADGEEAGIEEPVEATDAASEEPASSFDGAPEGASDKAPEGASDGALEGVPDNAETDSGTDQ
jgi:small subunit ribosomal protein S6